MNKHGLKRKHKSMAQHLKILYDEKLKVENKLSHINNNISKLEKAKNNCSKQIRSM